MIESKDMPLTVYGLLAMKHNTDKEYVAQVARGDRKPTRGKGARILADWLKLKNNFNDWMSEHKSDGSMIVSMPDIATEVCVKNGVAQVFREECLKSKIDVSVMTISEFNDFLNSVRVNFNECLNSI